MGNRVDGCATELKEVTGEGNFILPYWIPGTLGPSRGDVSQATEIWIYHLESSLD